MKKISLLLLLISIAFIRNYAQKNNHSSSEMLPLIFSDGFNDNANQWMESDRDSILKIIKDGKLSIENFSDDYPWSVKYANLDVNKNFSVSVSATHEAGYINHGYGIVMLKDSGDYYISFKISADGYYVIGYTADDQWNTVQDWKQSPHIKKGNDIANKLMIKHVGDDYEFYINDVLIEKRQNIPFAGEYVGMMSSGRQKVSFDDFELRGYKLKDTSAVSVYLPEDYAMIR